MAKVTKSNVLKFKSKTKGAKAPESTQAPGARKGEKLVDNNKLKTVAKADATATEVKAPNADKKVSQKLLETIERRKRGQAAGNGKGAMFGGKPPGRRGRRPKAVSEYVPGNNEEEAYVLEADHESIEYDTGIRVKEGGEDRGFSLDRFEDYDEELNFDW